MTDKTKDESCKGNNEQVTEKKCRSCSWANVNV